MLIATPSNTSALAPHAANRSWVVFLQVNPPSGGLGPVKIEGMRGNVIGQRLAQLSRDSAYELLIIGLIESPTPDEHADAIATQYDAWRIHDDWFQPTTELLAFINHNASLPLQELVGQLHPGVVGEGIVDVKQMAEILGVSVPTVRRMVTANIIPFMRWGRGGSLRFNPADVIASLQRHTR